MLYYREKIILSILEEFNNILSRTQLQKYLFLFTRMQNESSYNFIPYNFGCFSFQASKDLEHLQKDKLIYLNEEWNLSPVKKSYKDMLTNEDRLILYKIRRNYKHLSQRELVRQVYLDYPYYTIHSTIKDEMLSKEEQAEIEKYIEDNYSLNDETPALFTIGYEGISFEAYINKLIQNNIKVLIDVRKNPFSHKYGFSKSILASVVNKMGIKYVHIPELGIITEKRKKLETMEDYRALFDEYETTLPSKESYLREILNYMDKYKRIALTCFEMDGSLYQNKFNKITSIRNSVIGDKFQFCDITYVSESKPLDASRFMPAGLSDIVFQDEIDGLEFIMENENRSLEKHICWEYEKEARLLLYPTYAWVMGKHIEFTKEERLFYYEPTQLVGIILGALMDENDKARIKEIVKRNNRKIAETHKEGAIFDFVLFEASMLNSRREVSVQPIEIYRWGDVITKDNKDFNSRYQDWNNGWALVFNGNGGACRQQFS